MGNGQKREHPVLWPKTDVPENNSATGSAVPSRVSLLAITPSSIRLNVVLTYGIPPHTVQLVRRANCPCCMQKSHHVLAYGRIGELCNSFQWLLRL